jgi:hypothetical protein
MPPAPVHQRDAAIAEAARAVTRLCDALTAKLEADDG